MLYRTSRHYVNAVLLGRVALVAQRSVVVKLSRGRSVSLSVCPVHCRKTADRIRMPFGIVCRTGPGMRQVAEFGDPSTRRGTFGGEFGALTSGDFTAYVCDSAATRPSSQITLGRLIIIIIIIIIIVRLTLFTTCVS